MSTWTWVSAVTTIICTGTIGLGLVYRKRRKSYYQELALQRRRLIAGRAPQLRVPDPEPQLVQQFRETRIVRAGELLELSSLTALREEATSVANRKQRSYVPTHKKGGTVSYEQIHEFCPACLAFYHCEPVQRFVSQVVGERVMPAGDHDQSAESILYYDEPGDHIHWHFDHNFYEGQQFTALINLVNRSADGQRSASTLFYRNEAGADVQIDTSENSFVIFEGAKVLHRASPTLAGDLRIMLSMTFNTRPKITPFREFKRRVKDTAFFGIKALWK